MKLKELAERLECRLEGDPQAAIHGVAGIEQAEPGEVTFLANRRYAPNLKTTRASAVFIEDGVEVEREPSGPALAKLRTGNPYLSFAKAIELFYEAPKYAPGIHPTAVIAKSAKLGAGAHIGPYCFVDE
ncbi:MAG TPA: LpxD N-terminal domain-containing protein, partial [Candidatus Baltobacteraceae bacterium]|nr:LpxD N-terminal domain-containing protein [Candidatus Baltobacteraceae bacterium]